MNADGYADFLFTSEDYATYTEQAQIVFGGSTNLTGAESPNVTLTNIDYAGSMTAGDFDHDGSSDIVFADDTWDSGGSYWYEGRTDAFYGPFTDGTTIDVANADGSIGNTPCPTTTDCYFGYSITTLDHNGDGIDDLASVQRRNSPQAFIFNGGSL